VPKYFVRDCCSLKQIHQPDDSILDNFREDQMEMITFHAPKGGEAIILRNGDSGILVDCGGGGYKINKGLGEVVRKYLGDEILLTDLVASHNHHDHTNAFASLLTGDETHDDFEILAEGVRYIHNGEPIGTKVKSTLFPKFGNVITEHIVPLGELQTIPWRENQDIIMFKSKGSNNAYNSIVLNVPFRNAKFLLVGDLQSSQEKFLINNDLTSPHLKADVLKISHHGSKDSTTPEFVNKSTPGIFVSSSTTHEKHNLEDQTKNTIRRYSRERDFQFLPKRDPERITNSIFNTAKGNGKRGSDIIVRTNGVWLTKDNNVDELEGILFEVETEPARHQVNH